MQNSLLSGVKKFISQNPLYIHKDQFFLINPSVIEKLVEIAEIKPEDRILEVGPGLGFLTEELAQKAEKVITIEIDERLKPYLSCLPSNVEVIYGDAYRLLNNNNFRQKIMPITKSVSCIPYSRAQNMLHNYASEKWYLGDLVWLAPASLANKVNKEHSLGAYFTAKVVQTVPKSAFYPQPNTVSAIIYFKRILHPKVTGDFEIYFRRWLYKHEHLKVKNALREGIINVSKDLKGVTVTKNQAKKLTAELNLPQAELEKLTNNIKPEYYFKIPLKLKNWFDGL